MDLPGVHHEPAARLPTSPDDAARLDVPERGVGVPQPARRRSRERRPQRRAPRRADPARAHPRPVPGGVRALRDHAQRQPGPDVLPPHLHRAAELVRPPGPAPLRRRRLRGHRLGQRHPRHRPPRRLRPLRGRHHPAAARGSERTHRARLRPHRRARREATRRQADRQPQRHLLHAHLRHLADRLAGTHPRVVDLLGRHPRRPRDEHRTGEGLHTGRRRLPQRPGRGAERRPGRRHRHRRLHRVLRTRAERPSMVARGPLPLRPAGHPAQPVGRRRGHRHQLLRHARDRQEARQRRHATHLERPVRHPDRHPRPGLLARRPLHSAHRRRSRLRPAETQGPRLQHGAQAHQGRARPLVLPRRPARTAGVAGHPLHPRLRRQPHPGADRRVRDRSPRDHRRAPLLMRPSSPTCPSTRAGGVEPRRHPAGHHRPGELRPRPH